ncbi:MAG TPA: chromosome segregation SMC family protein [Candidatus Nitrosopolaris sp.]|nr:chromosome segregation SMC family protein [Candidatus Nitrosopolaris sp.]
MVHIKKLEVYGFKSFGFRNTVLNFEKGLVAITGPNGSGKSNILDAIMFAIGETSPKVLRVDKFQSLFHDSQNSSTRLIRASLSFDNSDRGIPVDSDSVTVTREMEGQTGESQYYLNKKKVTKSTLVELLEIVLATSNKLNIIQQGMITRISELNSEDRRKIIEDIIGLSYFDEKKNEALNQLNESDRRLDVAMARMDEIRKRIDGLEEERNDQLRYKHLESDLEKFKAVKISNTVRTIRSNLKSKAELLNSNALRSKELITQIDRNYSELENLESEKLKLIQEADIATRTKIEIGTNVSQLIHDSARKSALIKETGQRLIQIERRIASVEIEKQNINQKIENLIMQIEVKKTNVDERYEKLSSLKSDLAAINSQIDKLSTSANRYADIRGKLEGRHNKLHEVKNHLDVSIARLEEKMIIVRGRASSLDSENLELKKNIERQKQLHNDLSITLDSEKANMDTTINLIDNLKKVKATLQTNLKTSTNLLSTAETFTMRYEVKASTAKNAMTEDIAIAELMKMSNQFGIEGLVHNIITWNKDYERAVLAAGSEWMKAFVVDSVQSMISIAEYAKKKKLPRLKVIPLEIARNFRRTCIPDGDPNILGSLADFVNSDNKELPDFIFGNTALVKNPTAAYFLAREGCRAVSIGGELFEPSVASMSVDFGSAISDLTHAILLGNSIDILRNLLTKLGRLIEEKDNDLRQIVLRIDRLESEKIEIERKTANLGTKISNLVMLVHEDEKKLDQLALQNITAHSQYESISLELEGWRRRLSLVELSIARVCQRMERVADVSIRSKLGQMNSKRAQILASIDADNLEMQEMLTSSEVLKSEIGIGVERLKTLEEEISELEVERKERFVQADELKISLASVESKLQIERDREQQVIDSGGTSYGKLQVYEQKIKTLKENERKLSKENSSLEKDIALLGKDISDLNSEESALINNLILLGYKDLLDPFDVDTIIEELTAEFDILKTRINLLADQLYVQVIEGYRGMSNKRNLLDEERHSIVLFIEEIVTEKKNVFMEAFEKVDSNLRQTFSEVTGGTAWLEFENKEDEFSDGIMLMVQFQGKPGRESTALSGGEKTMAAIIFLLALQSLKPSPFYLMDEVDAHLDAQNTERLSKVLLERSKDNQMLMVTLKDATVAQANLIYGVYSRDGVSQVIRYKHSSQLPLEEIRSEASSD